MKTIFITLPEASIARNIFRTDFWDSFKESNKNNKIILITSRDKYDSYKKEFGGDGIEVVSFNKDKKISLIERILAFLALNSFNSSSIYLMQNRVYLAGETKIPPYLKKILATLFGKSNFFKRVVRFLDLYLIHNKEAFNLIEKYKPDLVFSTFVKDTEVDLPILREAKRVGVKTVGMTRSWDNLTTYGLLRVIPDFYIAQNQFLKRMAVSKHNIKESSIILSGLPHYDIYKKENYLLNKEKFFKKRGLDLNKNLIVYAAIGDYLFQKEPEVADIFEEIIENGDLNKKTQVIFRTHPAFESEIDNRKNLKNVLVERPGQTLGGVKNWEIVKDDEIYLMNLIHHSDVVVTAGSTFMIDSALFNKPIISIAFDGKSGSGYWFSIARFHEFMVHIFNLLKCGGVSVVKSREELISAINSYYINPSLNEEGRRSIVRIFADPYDGKSGERLSNIISNLIK
jgi:CDP-glycerol glycerophosphotransferase (TagB/SpsB family)